jgi:beta-lactamase regulating signal transducer with metallopeptidase domain
MSISGALIILAATLARLVALNRLPKRTFLFLWGLALIRLLLPFSLHFGASIFNLQSLSEKSLEFGGSLPQALEGASLPAAEFISQSLQTKEGIPAVPLALAWLIGFIISFSFFAWSYIKCRLDFMTSLPAENEFVNEWVKKQKFRRKVTARVTDRITSPLTYGIIKPVILLPKSLNWSDENQLSFILMHEARHIKRLDSLLKLIGAAALCIHWFNPLVWIMRIMLNRDIEIAVDEDVVKSFGTEMRSSYALALIGMEEKRNRFALVSNGIGEYAIEERIDAIMKARKTTLVGIILAILLVAATGALFATSGADEISREESAWEYLERLGFLEYDDKSSTHAVYIFKGRWVNAIYDPDGDEPQECLYADVGGAAWESVNVKIVRDGATKAVVGLEEMSGAESKEALSYEVGLSSHAFSQNLYWQNEKEIYKDKAKDAETVRENFDGQIEPSAPEDAQYWRTIPENPIGIRLLRGLTLNAKIEFLPYYEIYFTNTEFTFSISDDKDSQGKLLLINADTGAIVDERSLNGSLSGSFAGISANMKYRIETQGIDGFSDVIIEQ